jgi:hypothetical protein
MENANTINTVGMENVITVKTLKLVLKNVKNGVGMACVVPWKHVIIASATVVLAPLQSGVGTVYVIMGNHVAHVLAIADPVQLSVEMAYVPMQLNHVIHALAIAELAIPQNGAVTVHVIMVKTVMVAQATAEHVLLLCGVGTAPVITVKTVLLVGRIVGRVPKCHGVGIVNVIMGKTVTVVQQIVEPVLLSSGAVTANVTMAKTVVLVHKTVVHVQHVEMVFVHIKVVSHVVTAQPIVDHATPFVAMVPVMVLRTVVTAHLIVVIVLHQIHFVVTAFVTEKRIVRHVQMIVADVIHIHAIMI